MKIQTLEECPGILELLGAFLITNFSIEKYFKSTVRPLIRLEPIGRDN